MRLKSKAFWIYDPHAIWAIKNHFGRNEQNGKREYVPKQPEGLVDSLASPIPVSQLDVGNRSARYCPTDYPSPLKDHSRVSFSVTDWFSVEGQVMHDAGQSAAFSLFPSFP